MKELFKEEKVERGNTKLAMKAGFWYVFGTFITKGLAFIVAPIFAHIMTKADYGEFSNFANWNNTLILIVSFELQNTLSRAYYDFKDDYDRYASTACYINFFISFIFFAIFFLLGDTAYRIVSIPKEYTFLLFINLLFQGCRAIFLAKERTLYRYKVAASLVIISTVLPLLLSIILVFFVSEEQQLGARLYGFYVPYLLISLSCAIVLIKKGKGFKWEYFKYAIKLSLPLFISTFTGYLLISTNTIITKSVLGAESAAVVSVSTSIMNIILALFTAITGALTTWMMDNLELKRYDKVKKCTIVVACFVSIMAIGIMLFGPEIVLLFGGKSYGDALLLIPGLAFSICFQKLNAVQDIIFTYNKKIYPPAIVTAVITALTIYAKIHFLKEVGYRCLPIINIIAFALVFLINHIILKKCGYSNCYNLKGVLLILIVPFAFSLISSILYNHTIIRYIVMLVLIITVSIVLMKTKETWLPLVKRDKKKKEEVDN